MNKTSVILAAIVAAAPFKPIMAQEALGAPPTIDAEVAAPAQESTADDGIHGFFALGPGAVPAFDGAKTYQLIPLMIANAEWQGVGLEIRGLGARVDLLADSPLQVGPVFNFRGSRDSAEDGSGRVELLNDVDSSIEVGGYVGYRFGGDPSGQGEIELDLTVTKDVGGGHDGLIGTAQASYAAFRSQPFFLNVDAQASFADKKYMRAFFGVTPQESAVSGLSAWRPDSDIRDAGAGITAGYQFNERWGLIARAGATHYLGDAADSPVVEEGSKIQAVGGLALSFRF